LEVDEMEGILLAVAIVAGIGLIAGLGLAIASALMAVPKDERAEAVLEVLPGANCGACGYSGCSGYATALARGEAQPGLCSPGGADVAAKIAETLGVAAGDVEYKTALVHCMGSYDNTSDKMQYQGISSCAAAAQLFGGVGSCSYGCMGLGDCMNACEYGAITVCNGVASIDPAACRGCSQCVKACPKRLITFVPLKKQAVVRCSNCDKGGEARKACKAACIGCMRCVKACEAGAVQVEHFLARVDPQKCTACGKCAEVCPQGCISLFQYGAEP
jgi:electron transport complex protein RnfB